jgi:hypothetical protein
MTIREGTEGTEGTGTGTEETEATGSQTEEQSNGDEQRRKRSFFFRSLRFSVSLFVITVPSVISVPAAFAQTQQPVVSPAPAGPEFLSRYDFHLSAAALLTSTPTPAPAVPDQRFSWDTHFGGSFDVVDYIVGRTSVTIDYQAVLGSEYRPFDPNQGNYTLEAASSARIGDLEVVGIFHHVSRHLSDRPKRGAIAWNVAGARVLKRLSIGGATIDADVELGRTVQHAYVDYTWVGEAHLLVRRTISERVGVFAHGTGQFFGVDGTVLNRGTQAGGLAEAGVRVNGKGGALELFLGYEKRVDADPFDRQSQHWGLAGFRILSR